MKYTNTQKINGEFAIRTLSAKAQRGYAGTDMLTVYEVERDDYEDEDGWHKKTTYNVAVRGEETIENMTKDELDEYLAALAFDDEDK